MQVQKTFMQLRLKTFMQVRLETFMQVQKTFMHVRLKTFMHVQKTFMQVQLKHLCMFRKHLCKFRKHLCKYDWKHLCNTVFMAHCWLLDTCNPSAPADIHIGIIYTGHYQYIQTTDLSYIYVIHPGHGETN